MVSKNNEYMFQNLKTQTLAKVDRSKKGSYDVLIEDLIDYVNDQKQFCTTSSCSGRICIVSDEALNAERIKTKNCVFHFLSHEHLILNDVLNTLKSVDLSCKLKFEGFVIHIRCLTLEYARLVHQAAVSSGFRNSGISFGKKGRNIVVAVRGTLCLEVPLTDHNGKPMTSEGYVAHLVDLANSKLEENTRRIKQFEKNLKTLITSQQLSLLPKHVEKTSWNKQTCPVVSKIDNSPGYEISDNVISSLFNKEID